jgi:phage RecT family recombinase
MAAAQKPEPGTAVVRTVGNSNVPAAIATHEETQKLLAPLLPKGVTFDQLAAQVKLALAKDTRGDLKKCTVGSVLLAVMRICGWGLEVGVTAHLVPMGDQCQAWRDYTGDIQLAIESGMVRHVESYVVYEHEPFKIIRGTTGSIQHEPIQDPKARGPMVGVYALIYLRGYHPVVEYMTYEEVDAIRQAHSKQWTKGSIPRWYMKKTAIRQGLKLIPKSPRMRQVLAEIEADLETVDAAVLDERLSAGNLPSGTASFTLPDHRGPKPLVEGGYDEAPVPPAQHSDDPGRMAEDSEQESLAV